MTCTRCKVKPRMSNKRWCRNCHASYMKRWRRDNGGYKSLDLNQKYKGSCRSYANVYQKRGHIKPPDKCERCKINPPQEKHHEDYSKPLDATWLCRGCHVIVTNEQRQTAEKIEVDRLNRKWIALLQDAYLDDALDGHPWRDHLGCVTVLYTMLLG